MSQEPQWSADGQWWWDGTKWIPANEVSGNGTSSPAAETIEGAPASERVAVQDPGNSSPSQSAYRVLKGGLVVSPGGDWYWLGKWKSFLKKPSEPQPNAKVPKYDGAVMLAAIGQEKELSKQVKQAGTILPVQAELRRASDSEHVRREAYERVKNECPLPITFEIPPPIGGMGGTTLFEDEFLVSTAKDWGFSSQKLTLTTHRLIYTRGRVSKAMESVYLQDIRDVKYLKPLLQLPSLAVETASGAASIEGLPAMWDATKLRNDILVMVHYARQRSSTPVVVHAKDQPTAGEDIPAKLRQLKELHASGVLTDGEFDAKKAELLSRL